MNKTKSEKLIEEALNASNYQKIRELFFSEEVSDNDLFDTHGKYSGRVLRTYIGLSGPQSLKGKCFVGVNVKTSSNEPLKPISFRTTEHEYESQPSSIAEDGRITEMKQPLQELLFLWDPGKWNYEEETRSGEYGIWGGYSGAVSSLDNKEYGNSEVIEMFKSPFGRDYNPSSSENKYNILGDLYYKALGMNSGPCWVWIYHLDFDIDNGGKYLSFVLAMGDKREDLDTLMGVKKKPDSTEASLGGKGEVKQEYQMSSDETPRNMLINYILLVKARYVRKLERQRQVESVKSAVAAIMSRNMSHNLGSHYLYYTKTQLAALADKNELFGPDIRGAARVLGYMQARMDYLATIVSGDRYPYGSVFFKGQIFDELTIDDFSKRHFVDGKDSDGRERKYKRTTNYLLQNLILSENFTREPVLNGGVNLLVEEDNDKTKKRKIIRLQIKTQYGDFTGMLDLAKKENQTKLLISSLSVALPGNVMSIHAFYNVVENLIRNAAKYMKNDFKDELVITIAVTETKEHLPECYQFVIYDNKGNAFSPYYSNDSQHSLVDQMNLELIDLKILNDKNELDKSNKGLKEMLFSTLWMRAYTYKKSEKLSDILAQMDREKDRKKKWDEIRRHAFEYVAVDEKNGFVYKSDDNGVLKVPSPEKPCNLGICFELPKFRMIENVGTEELNNNLKGKALNNFTDIMCVEESCPNLPYLLGRFTRVHNGFAKNEKSEKESVEILKKILRERFPTFDEYCLCMEGTKESGYDKCDKRVRGIYFKTHVADLETMEKYAYCEAISGENFTKTMQDIFDNSFSRPLGVGSKTYKNDAMEYFALKIKESALTRITLVDERLYNDMISHKNKSAFLACKNIRVLNLSNLDGRKLTIDNNTLLVDNMFDGNHFRDENNENATLFLSIHLGMIEKIVKSDSAWVKECGLEKESLTDRVDTLMKMLRNTFKTVGGEVFISVHSGRGNFSKELDESLKEYPFISISAIESVYANSKFLLSQLFYNTVYIGKGELNDE